MGLEQSPAYFTARENPRNRAWSVSQPRSINSRDRQRSRGRSKERSMSPSERRAQKVPPRRRDSPSTPRICPDPI